MGIKKNYLKEFKEVLDDAGKVFNRPSYEVNLSQWNYVANGRMTHAFIKLFGFGNLKAAVAPTPNTSKKQANEARKMIERLVSNA